VRRKVAASVDDAIREESADATAILTGGRKVHVFVEHAIGSLARPLTDADLEAKFHALADPVIGRARAGDLIAAWWQTAAAADVQRLVSLARPA
jgi:2-methylcitrate dehydratase PrpD